MLNTNATFGQSVSLDGDYLAVGAHQHDGWSGSKTGAVYIFKRHGSTWRLQQEISDASSGFTVLRAGDRFGYSVSLSGERLAVGAYYDWGDSGRQTGAAYIFKRTSGVWALEQEISDQTTDTTKKILGLTVLESRDKFGQSVSLDGDRLAVGAPFDDGSVSDTGAIYVFKRNTTTSVWALEQEVSKQTTDTAKKILGLSDLAKSDVFGSSLSLDGEYLAVGAPADDGYGTDGTNGSNTGAVYIFKRTGTSWGAPHQIVDASTGFTALKRNDSFGTSLSLDGEYLAVGAPKDDGSGRFDSGAVYIVKRTSSTWGTPHEISHNLNGFTDLGTNDKFGTSVSLDGSTLAVGAPGDGGESGSGTGAVYVIERTGSTWGTPSPIVDASTGFTAPEQNDKFGSRVALDSGRFVSSALGDDGDGIAQSGAAYIFLQASSSWGVEQELSEPNFGIIDEDSWQSFKTSNSTAPNCSATYTGWGSITAGSSHRSVSFSSSDDDKWVCFRVKNVLGVYGYSRYQIDLTQPTIPLSQNYSTVTASTEGLVDHKYFTSTSDPDCSSSYANWSTATSGYKKANLADTTYICFRAKNKKQVYGYAEWQVDMSATVIELTQDDTTISITTTGLGGSRYYTSSDDPDCSDNYDWSSTGVSLGSSKSGLSDGHWVCFTAYDSRFIWGFAELQVDLTQPAITLTQNNDTVTASSTNSNVTLTGFEYFTSSSDPDCSGDYSNWDSATEATTTASVTDTHYVCFRAKNDKGVYGYKETRVLLTKPGLTATQNNDTVTASSTDTNVTLTGFEYFTSSSDPDCSDDYDSWDSATESATTTSVTHNHYVCFRAQNSMGVWGYFELRVNRTKPSFTLSQDDTTVAIVNKTGISNYAYFQADSDPGTTGANSCSDAKTTGWTDDTDGSIAGIADNKWICFRARNSLKVYGYARLEVDRTQPSITLTQNNDTVTASSTDSNVTLTGFEYFTSSSDPDCSGSYDSWDSATEAATTTSVTHNHYVCFRAKNSLNVYGYKELQVNRSQPSITLSQNVGVITASSTDTNVTLTGFEYFTSSSNPDCSGNYNSWDSATESTTTTSITHNYYVCFRAKNSLNVYGYKELLVDRSRPIIILTQDYKTVSASSAETLSGYQYFTSSSNPDCSENYDWTSTGVSNGTSKANLAADTWVCFRAKSIKNIYGHAELKVDLSPLIIAASQDEDSINAGTQIMLSDEALFGHRVSIDGDYLAVSANQQDGYSGAETGAVYIFKRSGSTWRLQQEISDAASGFTDLDPRDNFGYSLSLSGERLAVGARWDDGVSGSATGAVYIFKRSGSTWSLEQKIADTLSGFTSLQRQDQFGSSLALDGDRLAVGAPYDDAGSKSNAGAVYVFKRSGSTWSLEVEISGAATDTSKNILGVTALVSGDSFGHSLSLDGNYLAVGVPTDDGFTGDDTGAVYVFKRTNTTWAAPQKIEDVETGFTTLNAGDRFGESIALSGDYLAIGAPKDRGWSGNDTGAVYVFKRTGTTWGTPYEISDKGTGFTNLELGDSFGKSLDIDGDYLLVGAHNDGGASGAGSGAAYVFKRSGTTWGLQQAVADVATGFSAPEAGDSFGLSVAIDKDGYWVAGAIHDDGHGLTDSGAAYVFKKYGNVWVKEQELSDPNFGIIKDSTWQSFKTTTIASPNCSNTYTGWSSITAGSGHRSVSFASSDDDKWVCFRAKNNLGVYGYFKYQIDMTPPTIALTQNYKRVTAATGGLTDHDYFTSASNPDCSANYSSWDDATSGYTKDNLSHGTYICFRAKNERRVYGYAEMQVDTTQPSLTLKQNNTTVSLTTTGLKEHRYYTSSSNPNCAGNYDDWWRAEKGTSKSGLSDNEWICFRASNDRGIFGYAEWQLDLTQPVFSLKQDNARIKISETNISVLHTFGYFEASSAPPATGNTSCSGDYSSTWTASTTGRINSDIEDNEWVCFRAKNNKGVYGYAKLQIDLTKPTFSLKQDNTKVKIDDTEFISGFGYFEASSQPPTTGVTSCSDAYNSTWTSSTTGITNTDINNGKWICFRAKNDKGVYGYAKLQVDMTQPSFSLEQNNDRILIDDTTHLDAESFGYFQADSAPPATGNSSCSGDYTGTWTSSSDGRTAADIPHGKYICFRAKNNRGVYGYNSLQIDRTEPSMTLTQDNTTVTASGVGLVTFAYFISSDNPDCDWDDNYNKEGHIARNVWHNMYVCFTAGNSLGVYTFKELRVDLTKPTFTLTQDNTIVKITSTTGLSDFAYFQADSEPPDDDSSSSCSEAKISGWTADADGSISGIENGKWICFRAKNSLGVYGFAKKQVDLTKPNFTLTQDGKRMKITDKTGFSGYGYFQANSQPPATGNTSCSGSYNSTWTSSDDGITNTDIADNKWICFRAKNSLGVYGYAKKEMDLTKPSFTLTQDGKRMKITDKSGLSGYGYFQASSNPPATGNTSCSDSYNSTWTSSDDGITNTDIADNKWICFRAKNSLGVYGYAKKEMDLTQPSFTLTQDDNTMKIANTTGLSSYGYFEADSEPPATGATSCSDDKTTGWTADADGSISGIADNKWICFRAKNSKGVYGYAKLQVDLTRPSFTLSQDNTTVAMSTTTNLSGIGYFEASSEPPTTGSTSCSDDKTTGWTADADGSISGIADNKWICFRAKNSKGVYGYAKLQVDLTRPSFTLSQDNTTVAMSTTTNLSGIGYFEASSEPPTTGATSCSDDKTTGWTADADGSISGIADNKWICFRAKNSKGVYGYAKLQVDLTRPSFTLSQDNTTVAMSTTTNLSGIGYFQASSEPPTTGSTSCSDDKTTGWTADADGSISGIADNKWICFRAKNSKGVYGYAKLEVDLTKPSFTLTQDDNKMKITNTTGFSGYGYFEADSEPPATGATSCSDDKTTGWTADSDGSISDVEDNKWICFRAKNALNIYGYAKKEMDLTQPSFSLTQEGKRMKITNTNSLSGYGYFEADSEPPATGNTSCSDDYSSTWTSSSDGATSTNIADNKWICFRAKNSLGVYGYAKKEMDLTQPSFTLTQDGKRIKITNTTGLSGYGYFEADSEPPTTGNTSCSGDYGSTWTSSSDGATSTNIAANKWICFRAKNSLGVYGYAKLQIDLTQPNFRLSQDNATVAIVDKTGISGYAYFESSSDPGNNCSDDKTSGWINDLDGSISGIDRNKYICFRAKNSLGVYGYAKIRVDLTKPNMKLTQDKDVVTASSSAALTGYQYFTSASNPNCSETYDWTASGVEDGTSKSNLAHNTWICFRAKNDLGVYNYLELRVDLIPPSLNLSQSGGRVTISNRRSLSAFAYFEADSEPPATGDTSCSGDYNGIWTSSTTGSTNSNIESGKWVCFRAKNDRGIYGYASVLVYIPPPAPPSAPPVVQPKITLTQINNQVAATGAGLSDFAYFVSVVDLDCDNAAISYNLGQTASDIGHEQWVCFRAKNSSGVYGYAKLQVNLSQPDFSLTQEGSSVAPAETSSLSDLAYFKASSDPDCSGETTSLWISAANISSVDNLEDGDWICFRAKNSLGVYGYAELEVDLPPPVVVEPTVIVAQIDQTAVASGEDLSEFAYFVSSTQPLCSAANTAATYTKGRTIGDIESQDWVCFRAKNSLGVYGYAKLQILFASEEQISVTEKALTLAQNNTSVVAFATALSEVAYFKSSVNPDCDLTRHAADYRAGEVATNLADRQWVCFRAVDVNGAYSYRKHRVDLTPPQIDLGQSGRQVVIFGSNLADQSYFVADSEPLCGADEEATYTSATAAVDAANQQWVCVRAKNQAGVYGYSKYLVDLTPPQITISRADGQIAVQSPDAVEVAYFTADSEPLCEAGEKANYISGDSVTGLIDEQWVCFRVQNSKGVYGFVKQQAILPVAEPDLEPDEAEFSRVISIGAVVASLLVLALILVFGGRKQH